VEFQQLAMSPQGFTLAEFARVARVERFPEIKTIAASIGQRSGPSPTAFPSCATDIGVGAIRY
jgi:hypothetical protein